MKYFGYMPNDFINGEGVSVSLWTAGCPHRCPGCHNSEMWEYNNGYDVPTNLDQQLINAICDNNIIRNFSILGGEPLTENNIPFIYDILMIIRHKYPTIKIFLWTGYTIEYLNIARKENKQLDIILNYIDVLIEGPYIQEERDITLKLRGSKNQRVFERIKNNETNNSMCVRKY